MPRFHPGTIVATPAVLELLTPQQLIYLITRHLSCVWGDIDAKDAQANADALVSGGRLFSSYAVDSHRVWVITEAHRSSTCLLLSSEY